ncbi:MAG: arginine deiminase family protein [Thermomicrobiales bacterium]
MFGLRREGKKAFIETSAEVANERGYGGQSMVAPLKRVVVRRPAVSGSGDEAAMFNYPQPPNDAKAIEEHQAFIDILSSNGVEVLIGEAGPAGLHDAIFVYDTSFVTDEGVILLRPGKEVRRDEVALAQQLWEELEVPILGTIEEPGTVEGGDLLWVDSATVAVGQGYRTNSHGIDQLEIFLRTVGVDVLRTDLPYWTGPRDCLHLLSLLSPVAPRVAVAHLKLMSVSFVEELKLRDWTFIEILDEEFVTQATNVLALAPGKVLMLKDNPVTIGRLREAGYEVITYTGDELSHNRAGGPTCLTNPMLRDLMTLVESDTIEDADA